MAPPGASERQLSDARLRRIVLDRQGLLQRAPFGRGLNGTRRAIERLGYVQIDTISVVSRAHDHVLQTRVPGYRPDMLERLQRQGAIFEHWAHAAAYLPMADFRFARPRMHAMRARAERWVRSRDEALMRQVLDRVRVDGPLQTRDFDPPDGHRGNGWWDWKPAKRALEQLFMQGDLMVCGRSGFQKVYDLTERVLPEGVDTSDPTVEEYARYLIDRQLGAMGFASVASCVYQRATLPGLRTTVADLLESDRADGRLLRLPAEGGTREPLFLDTAALDGRAPAAPAQARALSPFDNLVIQRRLAQRLFGFDFQIECYVPEPRRRFGYFCLPLLYRDRLVGRADCKAHRRHGRLEIRRLFVEHPQWLPRDPAPAFEAMARALAELAGHNGCDTLELGDVQPRALRGPLARAVERINAQDPGGEDS